METENSKKTKMQSGGAVQDAGCTDLLQFVPFVWRELLSVESRTQLYPDFLSTSQAKV